MSLYEFGPYRLDTARRRLMRGGDPVRLTPKAFDTLVALLAHAGEVVDKDDLLRQVWPDTFVEEDTLAQNISTLRRVLGDHADQPEFIATAPRQGYRFIAPVTLSLPESGRAAPAPITGAMPLDSRHYVRRAVDDAFEEAVARGDSVVLLKGARQVGKSSLLARGLQRARADGAGVVLTDLQGLASQDLDSSSSLLLSLGHAIAEGLELAEGPEASWAAGDSANTNFGRFMRRVVLAEPGRRVVWGLDEVDRLFSRTFGADIFGLFRSWHNRRALDPDGPWRRLTLTIAYATEAHLFITDVNQSPFNIGTRLVLDDFDLEQVLHLNDLHGAPLTRAEAGDLHALLGGHPYLSQRALQYLAGASGFPLLARMADRDDGPFGDHLHRLVILLRAEPALRDITRGVLDGHRCESADAFYRLRSAGILRGESAEEARFRCPVYASYLRRHLS